MKQFFGFVLLLSGCLLSGCAYDVESELYPPDQNQACDTLNVGYQARIEPIINNDCIICHEGSGAAGNVSLENYEDVKQAVISRNLYGAVAHTSDKPMPQGGDKLPECDITAIRKWIELGFPQ